MADLDFSRFGTPVDEEEDKPLDFSSFGTPVTETEQPEAQPAALDFSRSPGEDDDIGRLGTAGSQFVRGATGVAAGAVQSIDIETAKKFEQITNIFDELDRAPEELDLRTAMAISQHVPGFAPQIVQYSRARDAAEKAEIRKQFAFDPRQGGLFEAGEKMEAFVANHFPVNPEFAEEFFAGKVSAGLGSMTAFMAAGLASRGASIPSAIAPAALGSMAQSTDQFKDALENDASIEEAYQASNFGQLIGLSEAIPVSAILSRLDKGTGGRIKNALIGAAIGGTEEAAQEAFQTITSNLVASDIVAYDKDRDMWVGSGEGAAVGFTTGGLMGFVFGLAGGRRGSSTPVNEGELERAAINAEAVRAQDPNAYLKPGDVESPIRTEDLAAGRRRIAEAQQRTEAELRANQILQRNNLPRLGDRVRLDRQGQDPVFGTLSDGFTIENQELGLSEDGFRVTLDDGTTLDEFAGSLGRGTLSVATELPEANEAASSETVPETLPETLAGPVEVGPSIEEIVPTIEGVGDKATPVVTDSVQGVDLAAEQAELEPTDAQKEAGNYKHGHVKFKGIDIAIETPKGATRSGTAPDGTEWAVEMQAHYGRVKGTVGGDGEQQDVYIGENDASDSVFVVDQIEPETGAFDEHKSILGVGSLEEAEALYDVHFDDGSGPARRGTITEIDIDQWTAWINGVDATKPLAYEEPSESTPADAATSADISSDPSLVDQDGAQETPVSALDLRVGAGVADTPERGPLDPATEASEVTGTVQDDADAPPAADIPTEVEAAGATLPPLGAVEKATKFVREKDGGKVTAFALAKRFDLTPEEARAVHGELRKTGELTLAGYARKNRTAPRNVFDVIKEMGGIQPDGDLRALDLQKSRPGVIVGEDKGGRTKNDIRQRLVEEGMLAENATDHDVTDLIDATLRGDNTIAESDRGLAEAQEDARIEELNREARENTRVEIRDFAKDIGEIFSETEIDTLAEQALTEGRAAEDVISDYVERQAVEALESFAAETQDDTYADIPFEDLQQVRDNQPVEDSRVGPAVEPSEQGQSATAPEGARSDPEPQTELTDQGEQTLIEGVAPVTDRDRIEAQADRPLQGGNAAPPAGGLFDEDARNQTDLLDAINAAPAQENADYGANNTLVDQDAAERAREVLRRKLNANTLNSGVDPEVIAAGTQLAVFHIEAGARSFNDFARAMIADMGEMVRPFLRGWYEGARHYPGATFADEMTPATELDAAAAEGRDIDVTAVQEAEDVPSTSESVEPDSGDTDVGNGVGSPSFPDGGNGDVRGTGQTGDLFGDGNRQSSDLFSLSADDAPVVGAASDSGVREGAPEPDSGATERGDGRGSGEIVDAGPPDDTAGTEQLDDVVTTRAEITDRAAAQSEADKIAVVPNNIGNIRQTLPLLEPKQQGDVAFAEARFDKPDGHGVMFTNGTGTGKTYTGGGVVKRFVQQGKEDVLIVVPSQIIAGDWMNALADLGVTARILESTTDPGRGVSITTYANLQENRHLADRDFDLVIPDEAHNLSSNAAGDETGNLKAFRAITNHPDRLDERARMQLRDLMDQIAVLKEQADGGSNLAQKRLEDARRELDQRVKPLVEGFRAQPRPKVVFLSATPFAYDKSIDYANGYLFDYNEGRPSDTGGRAYNEGSNKDQFFMLHFGYRMRNNKLTRPESDVNSEIMERRFHEWMREQGSLSGRVLEVEADYDRKFVLTPDTQGSQIDQAFKWLDDAGPQFRLLAEPMRKRFNYLARLRLLEAMKAHHVVPLIQKQHELGRKVVVFHDYNEGGGFSPFEPISSNDDAEGSIHGEDGPETYKLAELYAEFVAANPYIKDLNFARLGSPIATLTKAFPDAMLYNGKVSAKQRTINKAAFNTDGNGKNLIIIQSAAGEAGISVHDTTGEHERVLYNLGLPSRPVTAIQEEGRIYRTGQVSNAMFRYMNTGTAWEQWAFASKMAERAGTAENLALGERARTLKRSFIDAFLESDAYPPALGEGTGGKEYDAARHQEFTAWEEAKTFYFGKAKNTKKRDHREGIDFFATPEPVGLKMVEFANIQSGERVLEPSAGDGAIARFFPEDTTRTVVEPSDILASRVALVASGAKAIPSRFEDLHTNNKYDAIVMNPPYGVGGSMAIKHVDKATQHLRNGGRVVALIPTGPAADKKFDKWYEDVKNVYIVADMQMPAVTFERAGTKVMTRIVVLEKQTDPEVSAVIPPTINRDWRDIETIGELFERMEHMTVPQRQEPVTKEIDLNIDEDGIVTVGGIKFELTENTGATGQDVFRANPKQFMGREEFRSNAQRAEQHDGKWTNLGNRYEFDSAENRQSFMEAVERGDAPAVDTSAVPQDAGTFATAETTHAKKGIPLFVVQMVERVDKDAFGQLRALAKKHGGYYSSFAKNGAIPGFQFESEADRANFLAEAQPGDTQGTPLSVTSSRSFAAWFRGSKVVDEKGDPLVVHHGTGAQFDSFRSSPGWYGNGIYFTDRQSVAQDFANESADDNGGSPVVVDAFMSLQNPYVFTPRKNDTATNVQLMLEIGMAEDQIDNLFNAGTESAAISSRLKSMGHDGLIVMDRENGNEYIAFSPTQIKSVDNQGAFDPDDNRFQFSISQTGGGGIDRATLDGVVARVSRGWGERVTVKTVDSFADLPDRFREEFIGRGLEPSDVAGFMDASENTAWLIRENVIDAKDAEEIIYHEVYGHLGPRMLFGDEMSTAFDELFEAIGGDQGIQEIAERTGIDLFPYQASVAGAREDVRRTVLMDEMIAALAEDSRPGIRRAVRDFIGALKSFLRRVGLIRLAQYNETDIYDLLRRQRRAVERGEVASEFVDANGPAGLSEAFMNETDSTDLPAARRGRRPQNAPDPTPQFDDATTEARWQEARKGIANVETVPKRLGEWFDYLRAGFARHYIAMPNIARFSDVREQLRKLEAAPQASKETVIRILRDMTDGMTDADVDLFTRKVVLDDLTFEVEQDHDIPFGLTPESLKTEIEKIDAALADRPDLTQKLRERKLVVRAIANRMVEAGVLTRDQANNPSYYRHQVLDYARAQQKYAQGAGQRVRTPHWARREGSVKDINANLLEAEFEWLHKALTDIETAKTIEWIKDSDHNIRRDVIQAAKDSNNALISGILQADIRDNGYPAGEDRETGEVIMSSPLNDQWEGFRQSIAIGLQQVEKNLGQVRIPREFRDAVDQIQSGGAADPDDASIFPFLAWLVDNGHPGSMGAAMVFKAISGRRQWTKDLLGDRYADPTRVGDLVGRFAPEGYVAWQPDEGNLLFTAKTIPEHVVDRLIDRVVGSEPGPVEPAEMRAALGSVRDMLVVGGPKYQMVIPEEIADTLNSLRDEQIDSVIEAIFTVPMRWWKRWVLINPRRVVAYNLNNLSGDLDAAIAGNPKALRKLPQAIKELYAVMIRGESPSDRYREAVDRGVFDSGMTVQEIPDINFLSEFEQLINPPKITEPGRFSLSQLMKVWNALQRYTWFRENWLRYAAYLDYVERLDAGESQDSIGYGAAKPEMVDAIETNEDKAALLARELVGDYGAISFWGAGIRRKMIPFWSWMEINTKRYWRLNANAWGQGVGAGIRAGTATAVGLGARTTAYLTFRMLVVYGMVQLWNNLFFGEEEEELRAEDRVRLHINLGKNDDGEIRLVRFQGALSDYLSWIGFENAIVAISEVEKGRGSATDVLEAMAKAPVNKIAGGITPVLKMPIETGTGLSMWPDMFNPRPIRDPARHVARLFSVENEYDLIFDKPSRGFGASLLGVAGIKKRDVGETAYGRIKSLAHEFMEREQGRSGSSSFNTERSRALHEWRLAKKFGDESAEDQAMAELKSMGAAGRHLAASIKRAHPLGGVPIRLRGKFKKTLTGAELKTLELAKKWYDETYLN